MSKPTQDHNVQRMSYRISEAAKAIGVSERKIAELIADRTSGFPHARLGRVVVIPIRELEQWLADEAAKNGGAA